FSVVAALSTAACGTTDDAGPTTTFRVRPSVEQIQVTHATPGATLAVFDAGGAKVQEGTADKLGSLMFRKVPPGGGYTVRVTAGAMPEQTGALAVTTIDGSLPGRDFYGAQQLAPGFGYLKTRHGTTPSIH